MDLRTAAEIVMAGKDAKWEPGTFLLWPWFGRSVRPVSSFTNIFSKAGPDEMAITYVGDKRCETLNGGDVLMRNCKAEAAGSLTMPEPPA